MRHVDLYEMTKNFYDKRQKEINDRRQHTNGSIDVSKVTDDHLYDAGVSKREFDQMKLLLALDPELFRPSEFGSFSPWSMVVDVGKYPHMSHDVKEILYRPPKVKNLYTKYWQLAAAIDERHQLQENDRLILKDHKARYPRKTAEEQGLIDQIIARIEQLADDDRRELVRANSTAASSALISELQGGSEGGIGKLYYEGAGQEALDKWRALSEEERKAIKVKGDAIDQIDTDELEAFETEEEA